MREVNFSIPNVNKASVGITTALYDRRALDCTSTLPLINSLNHLAYLTTSSARIRDILTVDGGIERLICILKQGRSKDMMDMWKWNLAFQCVVNIGVRGTENVRTRVVEADMVPVIATILDNYLQVHEKCREKQEEAKKQFQEHRNREHRSKSTSFANRPGRLDVDQRTFRRHAPPPSIDVSATLPVGPLADTGSVLDGSSGNGEPSGSQPSVVNTTPDRTNTVLHRNLHQYHPPSHHRIQETQSTFSSPSQPAQSSASNTPLPMDNAADAVRPVRDIDRLASMMSFVHPSIVSQPVSPTTPLPPPQIRSPTVRPSSSIGQTIRSRRRPSIRHQNSTADSDDMNTDGVQSDESPDTEMSGTAEIPPAVNIQDMSMEEGESILAEAAIDMATPSASETQEAGTFNITHRGPVDGSIGNAAAATPVPAIAGLSESRPTIVPPPQPSMQGSVIPRYLLDRQMIPNNPLILAAMPREEDVLMSLQLLAYVSKYCNLRLYFQKSHLVPHLKIGKEIDRLDADNLESESLSDFEDDDEDDDECEEEFLLPNDLNIFPLVERFTTRYHSTDMQYWAGVVMRNLCRKDDTRGGIRQCAYYQCGKWEEYPRQFAKCRRCRRTKYCSKECQKSAWAFHRHWCIAAAS